MLTRLVPFLLCCFWLVLPVLAIDGLFGASLPEAFQPAIFWADIPAALALAENGLRAAVIGLTVILPLPVGRWRGKEPGFVVYAVGLAAYALSWLALIAWPQSAWSLGAAGFTAPAWTPLLWLAGIGLVADGPLLDRLALLRPLYWLVVPGFVATHLGHALLVWSRLG